MPLARHRLPRQRRRLRHRPHEAACHLRLRVAALATTAGRLNSDLSRGSASITWTTRGETRCQVACVPLPCRALNTRKLLSTGAIKLALPPRLLLLVTCERWTKSHGPSSKSERIKLSPVSLPKIIPSLSRSWRRCLLDWDVDVLWSTTGLKQ